MAELAYEQPFHTDVAYYEGRADGIATTSGIGPEEARLELARFRVPSGIHLDVVVNQAPRCRLSFDDGLDYDWHPIELVEWVRETVVQFEPAFRT